MLKTVALGYFLALINNIGVKNLKKILVTLQKGSKGVLDFSKFSRNVPLFGFEPFCRVTRIFLRFLIPILLINVKKYPSTTVFSKIYESRLCHVLLAIFKDSQKIVDNSSYERARVSKKNLSSSKGFLSCVKKS